MINLLFYIAVGLAAVTIAKGVIAIDRYIDRVLFRLQLEEDSLSQQNWFLKCELYRKGVNGNATETGCVQND